MAIESADGTADTDADAKASATFAGVLRLPAILRSGVAAAPLDRLPAASRDAGGCDDDASLRRISASSTTFRFRLVGRRCPQQQGRGGKKMEMLVREGQEDNYAV